MYTMFNSWGRGKFINQKKQLAEMNTQKQKHIILNTANAGPDYAETIPCS